MAEDTRARLLDAAGEVFAAHGYEVATIRDICQRAGANLAAVNYHFGDKHRLYVEAVRQAYCLRSEQFPLPEQQPGVTSVERLRRYVRMFLERLLLEERRHWHKELILRELARPTDACAEVVRDFIRPMASLLEEILLECSLGLSHERLWLVGFSVVGQCLFYYVQQPIAEQLYGQDAYRELSIEKLANHIADFTLAALGLAPPLRQQLLAEVRA
ncbi:MAG: CerR family C-terminal domain-containing protein [Pirellulales bacterium]|nr:CerR family C-terminal domain-containing protein [Pirellulales bacterium]